jgi:cyclopropane fatty-acyl-phospholipid synthase-like methyltransferase
MSESGRETWDKVAEQYEQKFMDMDIYNAGYDKFSNELSQHARVLEIGCGPGNITKYLQQKRPDLEIMATDHSQEMIRLAKKNCPAADCRVMDARQLNLQGEIFAGIICGFCIPYLSEKECEKLISDCCELLVSEGVFYLSLLEGRESDSGYESSSDGKYKMFVHYYSEETIVSMLNAAGFALTGMERLSFGGSDKRIQLIVLGKKSDLKKDAKE